MPSTAPDVRVALHTILKQAIELEEQIHSLLPDLQATAQIASGRRRYTAEEALAQARIALTEVHGAGMRIDACAALFSSSAESPPR